MTKSMRLQVQEHTLILKLKVHLKRARNLRGFNFLDRQLKDLILVKTKCRALWITLVQDLTILTVTRKGTFKQYNPLSPQMNRDSSIQLPPIWLQVPVSTKLVPLLNNSILRSVPKAVSLVLAKSDLLGILTKNPCQVLGNTRLPLTISLKRPTKPLPYANK